MNHPSLWFALLLPFAAFAYASAGHGGATAYLALMTLAGFAPEMMRPVALTLNCFVAAASFLHFRAAGHFRPRLFWRFAAGSIPAAFAGGLLHAPPTGYRLFLAVFFVFAALRMLGIPGTARSETRDCPLWQGLGTGAVIGFLSGLLGIGGGIVLGPILLLAGWGAEKEAAAISGLFIFVNSLAGLGGLLPHHAVFPPRLLLWIPLALLGGWLGARHGSRALPPKFLRRILAALLLLAATAELSRVVITTAFVEAPCRGIQGYMIPRMAIEPGRNQVLFTPRFRSCPGCG